MSILSDVKKAVNISPDDPSFDIDVIMAINTEFSTLTDVGVGPVDGFVIEDDSVDWDEFIDVDGDPKKLVMLAKVKMAVILKTRLLFDPPTQSFLITSMENQLLELEWRLNANREATDYTDPIPPLVLVEGDDE